MQRRGAKEAVVADRCGRGGQHAMSGAPSVSREVGKVRQIVRLVKTLKLLQSNRRVWLLELEACRDNRQVERCRAVMICPGMLKE